MLGRSGAKGAGANGAWCVRGIAVEREGRRLQLGRGGAHRWCDCQRLGTGRRAAGCERFARGAHAGRPALGVFAFVPADEAAVRALVQTEITSGTLSCDPPGRLDFWPRVLHSPIDIERVRSTGFRFYSGGADAPTRSTGDRAARTTGGVEPADLLHSVCLPERSSPVITRRFHLGLLLAALCLVALRTPGLAQSSPAADLSQHRGSTDDRHLGARQGRAARAGPSGV